MKLVSAAFNEGGIIPSKYTCEGEDISPPLEFLDVPKEAKSLVLIMDDHDVPKQLRPDGIWDHWVVFNISPKEKGMKEGTGPKGVCGRTTSGEKRYEGPCPPDREHRYVFRLYALDQELREEQGVSKREVEEAMKGHVLAEARLMGRYEKGKGY